MIQNRKVYFFIIIFLVSSYSSKSQDINKQYTSFINTVKEFIDSSKINSIDNGDENIYCIKLFSNKNDPNSYVFVMTFIVNDWDTADISAQYMFYLTNDILILNTDSFFQQPWFKKISLLPFDDICKQKMINRLYKTSRPGGVLTYADFDPPGLSVLYKNDIVSKKYYRNARKMPLTPIKYPIIEYQEIPPPK